MPRYSDAAILAELAACADRLGRSPTMREFAADPGVAMHPHTVVARFGTWNAAKRRAGLVPRRLATDEELLAQLRTLGAELGRTPTGRDLDAQHLGHVGKGRGQRRGRPRGLLRQPSFPAEGP